MNCARTCLFFLPLVLAARLVCAQDNPPPGPAAPAAAAAKTRVLKHYLLEPSPSATVVPYLQYGLLQRIARQRGRQGAAVMYDAGLMAGTDLHLIAPLFFELAFHVSHRTSLGDDSRNASNFEVLAGTRLTW